MYRSATIAALGLAAAIATGAQAPATAGEVKSRPTAVVELFTSQGCSSCPPADALLMELGGRPEIVALAYHVNYWDYIGWEDTFGSQRYSDFQRAYARSFGEQRVYTPQLVVNGRTHVVGSRRGEVSRALASTVLELPVSVAVDGDFLSIEIEGRPALAEASVWLVTYRQLAEVEVERGENRGRDLAYSHIVTNRQVLGMWEPQTGARMRLPLEDILVDGSDGIAVLVQLEDNGIPGAILGAAAISL